MVLVDHTGWKLHRRQWTGTTEQLIEQLESTYDNAPNMFSIRIHHGGRFQRYPGRMYVGGRVDIFDMVYIDLFTVIAMYMMVLKLGYTSESEPMFYNYLISLISLDEGLYALACEEDVRFLATLVRSFKLIEVYIEHGVTVLDSYLRAPRFGATLKDIADEPADSIAVNRIKKMLLLTWNESSETTKKPVCDSVTPSSLPQHDSSTPCKDSICESITPRCMPGCIFTPPTDESVITHTQLSGVHEVDTQIHVLPTIHLKFSDINLSFVSQQATASQVIDDVMSSGLSHDESFGVDDLDLNLNELVNLNVSQVETQSKLPVSEEPYVGHTQEPILAKVSTQEPIVAEVSTQEPIVAKVSTKAPIVEEVETQEFSVEDVVIEDYVSYGEDAEQGNGQEDESAHTGGQFFYDDEGIDTAHETEYDVQYSEDADTYDDDVNEYFLVDEANEIVEPDVDVHLFGISMDLPFENIGITNLVSDDVLKGEDVDVINADGFDNDLGNDEERNYRNRRRNLKMYKNDSVGIRARCEGKVPVFTMSQGTGPTGPNRGMKAGPSGSSGPTTRSKKRKNIGTNDDSQASPSFLDAHDIGDLCPLVLEIKHFTYKLLSGKIFEQVKVYSDIPVKAVQDQLRELESTNLNTTIKIAVERNTGPSLPTRVFQRIYVCLGALKLGFRACRRDLLGLDGAFMKGSFPGQVLVAVGLDSNNGIYPLAYALVEAETKSSWCWFLQCLGDDIDLHPNLNFTFIGDRQKGWYGQAYKDLLWRAASATKVRDFKKCILELKMMNPKAHEWLNKIPAEHWAKSNFSGRAKSDLFLNNICEVFNSKIVGGKDKPVITLLEYTVEYCMKRIVNVQGFDKCTGPLTHTATRIMESIKKEAHLMKVQWNGANKYQVSGSLGDQCVVNVVGMTCSCRKWELTRIPYKRVVAACWNMALNDRETPPLKTWGKDLTAWKETYSHKIQPICGTKYWEKSTCPTTLLPPRHHVQVTCKGQGRKATTGGNNAEGNGSASRQAQQIEPAVGQDGSGGSGTILGAVIGLSAAAGEGGARDLGGAGVASQGSSHTRWTRRRVQTERISPQKKTPTQPASQPSTSFEVPVSQTRNAYGREMGDGIPTQSSAPSGASEWSFL
nr:hypothetical protein [Tanacetum cinerariifolium]